MLSDFIFFRRMLTPWLLQCFFWVSFFSCIVAGILLLIQGQISMGLITLLGAPFMLRITCEFMILFFRMNETLTDLKNHINSRANF
jgi:hypothetical protein